MREEGVRKMGVLVGLTIALIVCYFNNVPNYYELLPI